MEENVKLVLDIAAEKMGKTIEHFDHEIGKVRAGKANPKMLESVMVDYYGAMTPLSQVANINTPDARTIAVQPWEKKMIPAIEKAIMAANLGMNPDNNGEIVRINVPPLTEERRKDLVKQVKKLSEDTRIAVRNIRRDAIEDLKKLKKDGLGEDLEKDAEDNAQKITDKFIKKIDELFEKKEKDILTV
ncbi:MAG: ribosome recycling factor [Cytophagaceae bacterium]|jgi:ribosome recycling factor|nr:ribosome recycling factor [Cytophagaceae bacterium]